MPKLYLFPTGNAFHGSCLCAEVCDLAPAIQRRRIHRLAERLAAMAEGSTEVPASGDAPAASVDELRWGLQAATHACAPAPPLGCGRDAPHARFY